MACSARSFAGLLHPAADPGVRRVSGFCLGSLAGSRVSAVPVGASTLRSFSLASRRLPVLSLLGEPALLSFAASWPVRRPSRRRKRPRILRLVVLPMTLAGVQFNFRALGRWSNPPSRPDVSTRTHALLPWVSSFVRLSDSSRQIFGPASNSALRRYRPAFPSFCTSSSNTRGPRLEVRTPHRGDRQVALSADARPRRPALSPSCSRRHGTFGGSAHQLLPGSQKVRSSRIRSPKLPCPFGPLDSEIEDLSTFSEVAFREDWLGDSRTGASSCDGVPVLLGLLGASWAPGFTGTFRRSAVLPWKPGS